MIGEILGIMIFLGIGFTFLFWDYVKEFRHLGVIFIGAAVLLTIMVCTTKPWHSTCLEKHLQTIDYADKPSSTEWICTKHKVENENQNLRPQ